MKAELVAFTDRLDVDEESAESGIILSVFSLSMNDGTRKMERTRFWLCEINLFYFIS